MFHRYEKQLDTPLGDEDPNFPNVDDDKANAILDDHDEILYEYVWLSDNEIMTETDNCEGQTENFLASHCDTKLTEVEDTAHANMSGVVKDVTNEISDETLPSEHVMTNTDSYGELQGDNREHSLKRYNSYPVLSSDVGDIPFGKPNADKTSVSKNVREDENLLLKHDRISEPDDPVKKDAKIQGKVSSINLPSADKPSRSENVRGDESLSLEQVRISKPDEYVQKESKILGQVALDNLQKSGNFGQGTSSEMDVDYDNIESKSESTETVPSAKNIKSGTLLCPFKGESKKNLRNNASKYELNGKITASKEKSNLNQVSQVRSGKSSKDLKESANKLRTAVKNLCKHIKQNDPTSTNLCTEPGYLNINADTIPEARSSLGFDLKQHKRLGTIKPRKSLHKITRLRKSNLPCDTGLGKSFVKDSCDEKMGKEFLCSSKKKLISTSQSFSDFVKDDSITKKGFPDASQNGIIMSEKSLCVEKYRRKREFWIRNDKALHGVLMAGKADVKVARKAVVPHYAEKYDGSRARKPLAVDVTKNIHEDTEKAKSNELEIGKSVDGKTDKNLLSVLPSRSDSWMRFMPTPTTVKLMEKKTSNLERTKRLTKYSREAEKKAYTLSQGISDVYSFNDGFKDICTNITEQKLKDRSVVLPGKKDDNALKTNRLDIETDNIKMDSDASDGGMMLDKRDKSSTKGKDMHNCSLKTMEEDESSNIDQEKFNDVKKTATAICSEYLTDNTKSVSSKADKNSKRNYHRRKPVNVFCTKNGVRKVSKRYPCRYCGELFTLSYVRFHEHKHGTGGQRKVFCRQNKSEEIMENDEIAGKNGERKSTTQTDSFHSVLKPPNTSSVLKSKQMLGTVNYSLDGNDVAQDTTYIEEKGKNLDVKTHSKVKSSGTDSVQEDSPIPDESAIGFQGDSVKDNKMDSNEINECMILYKEDKDISRKGKVMHKDSLKTMNEDSIDHEKLDNIKKTATAISGKEVKDSRRNYYRRKPVKVFSTKNGVKKVSKRYPCKYCGELFTLSYVRIHEHKHGTGGQQKLFCRQNKSDEIKETDELAEKNGEYKTAAHIDSFDNVFKSPNTSCVPKTKQISESVIQSFDGDEVAKDAMDTEEKGKNLDVKTHNKIKSAGTDSVVEDSPIPDESAIGFKGDPVDNKMESKEMNEGMMLDKKDMDLSKKRKGIHKCSPRTMDEDSIDQEKNDEINKSATAISSKKVTDSKRRYYRRKPVKVFCTKNGVRKVSKRYPCKYSGELFSTSYVSFHEHKHETRGQRKVFCRQKKCEDIMVTDESLADKTGECKTGTHSDSFDNVFKSSNTSCIPKTKQMSESMINSFDGDDIAKGTMDTNEKGKYIDVKTHNKIKRTGTDSVEEDSLIPEECAISFQGDPVIGNKLDSDEISGGIKLDKKNENNIKKRKDMHKNSLKTMEKDKASIDKEKIDDIKKTASAISSKEVKDSKRKYYRRKSVKVFCTKNGLRKVSKRYPCKYCGELFSWSYVRFHENKHGNGGQQKVFCRRNRRDEKMETDKLADKNVEFKSTTNSVSFDNVFKSTNTSGDSKTKRMLKSVNHSLHIAKDANNTEEEGKNTDVKKHNKVKSTGTDSILEDLLIPDESAIGFQGDPVKDSKMESNEINGGVMLDKKDKDIKKKGKGIHKAALKTNDKASIEWEKNTDTIATAINSKKLKDSKRKYYRRKPVKIFCTKNGVRKVSKRYPCRYCGELFSLSYVSFHEHKHGTGGQQVFCRRKHSEEMMETDELAVKSGECKSEANSDSFNNVFKSPNTSCNLKTKQMTGCVNHSLDVANDNTDTEEKGKNIDVKTHNKIKITGTDSILPDSTIPEVPTIDFQRDPTVSKDFKMSQLKKGKKKQTIKYRVTKNSNIKKVELNKHAKSALNDSSGVKLANLKTENDIASNLKRELDDSDKKQNQHPAVKEEKCLNKDATKVFKCSKCLYSTLYKNIYMRHLTVHNDEKIFSCHCGITFRSQSSLEQWHKKYQISCKGSHVHKKVKKPKQSRVKSENRIIKTKGSQIASDTGLLMSVKGVGRSHTRQKCDKCNYRFSNRSNWFEHKLLHENNAGYSCRICCITMKTKDSLAFWHHRHGINHCESKKSKKKGNKKKVKLEKIDEIEQISVSVSTHDKDCLKALQTSNIEVEKQKRETNNLIDINNFKEKTKHEKKLEMESYLEFGMDNIDQEAALVGLNEKLDGTICEWRPKKLKIRQESGSGGSPVTFVSRKNRTGNSVEGTKSRKAGNIEANHTVSNVTGGIENYRKELTDLVIDKESVLFDTQSCTNRPKDSDLIESEAFIKDNKVEGSLELPVYPLIRKLSLKDGETVYSPVDDEIEVFEKKSLVKENYHKVKVLNIDTDGCLEIIKEGDYNEAVQDNDLGGEESDTEKESMFFSNNKEAVSDEPMDLSAKRMEPDGESLNANQNISLAFEIQIDLDRRYVTNIQPNLSHQLSCNMKNIYNESFTCYNKSANAKIIVKNLNVVGIDQTKNIASGDSANGGSNSLRVDEGNISNCQNTMNISDVERKLEIETEVTDNDGIEFENHGNDFACPDVEEMDESIFYASKLEVKPYRNEHAIDVDRGYETFEESLNVDVNRGIKIWETSTCDTGETDENNNRKEGEKVRTRHRNSEGTGGSGGRDTGNGNDGSGRNRGGRDDNDDGDGKENRDANNNEKDRDRNHNVELLPCIVCQETFSNKTDLMRHLTKIHRLTNMCQICYFDEGEIRRFANPVSLRNHKVRDHPEDMVKCVCGAMLIDNKMLSSHLKKFKCNIYDTVGESNEMAKCICGKRFASQEFLFNHRSKCRKRHCLDEPFLEYMSTSQQGKRRCLESCTSENVGSNNSVGMTLRAKVAKDNTSMSEDSDTSHGRSSKGRKCKENVLTYSERLYDKYFETAVKTGSYKQSKRKSYSQLQGTRRYERLSACTHSLSDTNDVLDLRTKSVRDRNNNAVNVTMDNIPQDINDNIFQETCESKSDLNVRKKGALSILGYTNTQLKLSKKLTLKKRHFDNQRQTLKKCVHAKKKWALVRTTSIADNSDNRVKYRCSWCRFVSVHWGTAVRHHYMHHQEKELDLIRLTIVPKKSLDRSTPLLEKEVENVLTVPEKLDKSLAEQNRGRVTENCMGTVREQWMDRVKEQKMEIVSDNNMKSVIENNVEIVTEEKLESLTEQRMESVLEQKMEIVTENNMDCVTDNNMENITENNMVNAAENNMGIVTENNMYNVTKQQIESVTGNEMESVTEQKMESVTENDMGSVTENKMKNVTENNMYNVTEQQIENVTGNEMESVAEQKMEIIIENNMGSVKENRIGNVTENNMESAKEKNMGSKTYHNLESITEYSLENVSEQKAESVIGNTVGNVTQSNMENVIANKMGVTKQNLENVADQKLENVIESTAESGIKQNRVSVIEQKTDSVITNTMEKVFDNTIEKSNVTVQKTESFTKLNRDNFTIQNTETVAEQNRQNILEQIGESLTKIGENGTKENKAKIIGQNKENVTEQNRESVIENVTDHNKESVTEYVIENVIDPEVGKAAGNTVENGTENTLESVTEQTRVNVTEEKTDIITSMMESVSENDIENVTEQNIEAVTEQNIEAVTEQNIEAVTEQKNIEAVIENVTDQNIESVTEQKH